LPIRPLWWLLRARGSAHPVGSALRRVPFTLLEPGERVLGLSASGPSSGGSELVEFRAAIERGVNYGISKDGEGNPELVVNE
jgi:hypothetical protein